ncbi:pentatricopeptide repeat-containing protein At3g03580 [Mercurialis annua]|uniref:pentatricopeptide repeat-containing protein At3g03580 n=1 Tax=Mercurialis annua TaxID=3986 RepID=UPI00215DFBBF|nr:pentatricopeptide repeat-containing protein At3g03580 [Mercurialis annua]XP_050223682.1 pentatricopeptide repeat-containing protein At3g03580 [Mercurialis annua]XP_050223683.1 pentatricopeptide repeat-containing protein At3g03580 [Mercurialis annua]
MKTAKLSSTVNECTEHLLHSSLSKSLLSATNLKHLHKLHSLIITSGFEKKSVFFSGNLISKYAKFRDPHSSLLIFQQFSPKTNVYQWNSIIRALTHNGMYSKALDFYSKMREFNIRPDTYTFPSVINACAALGDFGIGIMVHEHVMEMGFGFDLYIGNALVDMYARFGDLINARKVFDEMSQRDIVSWNSLISGFSANGYWVEALEVYYQLRMDGLRFDCFTISSVLPACGGVLAVKEGEVVHGLVEKFGFNGDVIVSNGLLSMYFKFDRLMDAQRVFDKMVVKDTVSWNTLICGYYQMGLLEESFHLFMEMVSRFTPDLLTITSVLRACGLLRDLACTKFVHDYLISSGIECDITASNIIIDTYVKCGDLVASRKVFETMKCRDTVTWNTLVNGYLQSGSYVEGVKLFKKMKMDLEPDSITFVALLSISTRLVDIELGKGIHCDLIKLGFESGLVVGNALIDLYAKCGKIDDSLKIFENMKVRDIVTWNTIIASCVQAEDCSLAFRMINQMRSEELTPDMGTLLGILPICSLIAAKRQGKEVHACTFKFGFESTVPVGNALIEMYSKCGNLKYCVRVFEHMKAKDVVTWTALISAYGMYGEGKNALRAFEEMEAAGIIPDYIAFVSVIYACSHSGLVEEGLACFERMKDYSIEPRIEHYACVVDLLSRSGQLSKAEQFIGSMPLKPDASIWGSLLSACRASTDLKIAERIAEHILQLHSDDPGYYILVSNVYAALGRWDEVRNIRKCLKNRGLKKDPGCSWIEIKNRVYSFGAGDKFYKQYEEVNKYLEELADQMAKEGYVADLKFAMHDVEDDEKRGLLSGHSERLAIAFGLLNTEPGTPLQVLKNLRVCGDCHTWTKYISKIVKREILVRDANRFHMFQDGACSCEDHW